HSSEHYVVIAWALSLFFRTYPARKIFLVISQFSTGLCQCPEIAEIARPQCSSSTRFPAQFKIDIWQRVIWIFEQHQLRWCLPVLLKRRSIFSTVQLLARQLFQRYGNRDVEKPIPCAGDRVLQPFDSDSRSDRPSLKSAFD